MEKISIRRAVVADAALLARIGREAFYSAFADKNTPENMEAYLSGAFSEQIQAKEIRMAGSKFLIAETEDRELVGYARLYDGDLAPTCITGRNVVELVRFYMLPQWIGQGTAGQLMAACLDEARGGGYDVVWLGVWQENPRAVKFYEKWGFRIVGTHTFHLGTDIQQDWLMEHRFD